MRRIKVLASAAGERDFVNRMRLWFGGSSVAEVEATLGRRLLAILPDAFAWAQVQFTSYLIFYFSMRHPGFRMTCWNEAIE
jgi:hypothetical protein